MFALWIECLKMALRELRRHKTRSLLTTLGIIMGVGAVIMTVSVTQGAKGNLEQDIKKQGRNMIIIKTGSSNRAGLRGGAGTLTSLTVADAEAIEKECSAVAQACALHQFPVQAVTEFSNWRVPLTGVTQGYTDIRIWPVEIGRTIEPRDVALSAKVCLIGQTANRELFAGQDPVGRTIRVAGVPLKVIGLLSAKGFNPLGTDEDNTLVVPLNVLLRQVMGQERPAGILASAKSDELVEIAVEQIKSLLRQRHRLGIAEEDDFEVTTLKEKIELANALSNVMTLLMCCIAGVSLLVGGIGIMNIMLVAVSERTREIGIRMAIGASQRAINRQFLIEACTISTAGGVVGVAFGVFGSFAMSSALGWEPSLSLEMILLAFAFSAGVGILFGILPARRAASLNPIEALRHD
ncbi:MAG: ABC transporter permease [Phycisphaerae bacterium]|nr:ABC transporter permease [Phycisphaerae bacterium]NUQ44503.1 ABC transporter permease [Phycisphaerae bacterium]